MKKISLGLFLLFISSFAFFLYSVSSILMPFIVSFVIAYFLNPLTKAVVNKGLNREFVVGIIVGVFVLILVGIFLKLVPALFSQIHQFIVTIPKYEAYVSENVLPRITELFNQMDPKFAVQIKAQLSNFSNKFFEYLMVVISNVFNSSLAILNIVGFILFMPILVFYLLRDWPKVVYSTDHLIPLVYKNLILEQFGQIDQVLSAYIRGQINVCLIISLYYVIALSILGVDYALLIGIITGVLIIIPYLGVIIGFIICTIVALLQFSDLTHVYVAIAIFFSGHLLESFIITPKLIGEKVGLHPVWVIFSLMAGGAMFGFWGIFFAIPMAAIVGVLFKCLLKIYFSSSLYNNLDSKG